MYENSIVITWLIISISLLVSTGMSGLAYEQW